MYRIALASTAGAVLTGLAALTGCSSSPAPAAARPAATVTVTVTAS
jgi:predicted component of type VI protein secretion system